MLEDFGRNGHVCVCVCVSVCGRFPGERELDIVEKRKQDEN